ncbi:hypothetical protein [Brucella anthropi]|uniref:hypothetical protein n=1 Tax=Brucella anthropi TaxID=529 RepID=UPI00320AF0F9
MKAEKREVFISDDGKVFDTVEACQAHEREIAANAKRLDNLKGYIVRSSFDSTEGRGYHQTTYILTDASYPVVLEYCLDRFGRPLSGWYGDGYYERWLIWPADEPVAELLKRSKGSHTGVGLSSGAADVVFLSSKTIDHPDIPKPVYPWPKKKDAKK